MTNDEFEKKYSDFVKVLNKALSTLDDNEIFTLIDLFDMSYNFIKPDERDCFIRDLITRMRDYRRADSNLKDIKESAAVLKALL
jgi:hypothetical protein